MADARLCYAQRDMSSCPSSPLLRTRHLLVLGSPTPDRAGQSDTPTVLATSSGYSWPATLTVVEPAAMHTTPRTSNFSGDSQTVLSHPSDRADTVQHRLADGQSSSL